jgi:rare lipoprotein A
MSGRTPLRRLAVLALAAMLMAGCAVLRPGPRRAPPTPSRPPPPTPGATIKPSPHGARPADEQLLALPDAIPQNEPRARLGNPPFYEVYGQRYNVLPTSHGFVERGVASWYGPDFHGISTSTGEPYDMYGMTAAHKTLPLPAYARITNLKNGRSVVVRINDRGPFKANRIVDVSYAVALKLDMIREGTALVELRTVDAEAGSVAAPAPRPTALYAQVGAFGVSANAERLRARLETARIGPVLVRSDVVDGRTLHRVRVGPVDSVDAYDALVQRLHDNGISAVTLAPN